MELNELNEYKNHFIKKVGDLLTEVLKPEDDLKILKRKVTLLKDGVREYEKFLEQQTGKWKQLEIL